MTNRFLDDVAAAAGILRAIGGVHEADLEPRLIEAAAIAEAGSHLVFAAMGSSLSASMAILPRLHVGGRLALAIDAGELLYGGLPGVVRGAPVVLVSQSGRSAEIVRLVDAVRRAGSGPLVAVTNDVASPLAAAADVVLPIFSGTEQNVATKTFLATLLVLHRLVDRMLGQSMANASAIEPAVSALATLTQTPAVGLGWADHFAHARSLVVLGRAASTGIAQYAALTLKETARIHAEALSGGAFRHGPLELAGPDLGVIVLADDSPTRHLQYRIAGEVVNAGSPTWVVDTGSPDVPSVYTGLGPWLSLGPQPQVGGQILTAAAVQLLAAGLATRRGLQPGVMQRSGKVTLIE